MTVVQQQLESLGVKHAPIQENPKRRYVTTETPPGIYYILKGDNPGDWDSLVGRLQLIFVDVPETASWIADKIGWDVEKVEPLPVTILTDMHFYSAILRE